MIQLSIDFTSRELGQQGMQRALDNEKAEWIEAFLKFAEKWAEKNPLFKCEDLRADFIAAGNPPPHHPNVYGAIAQHITKRGIGIFVCYVKSVSPKTHGHPVAQYRSLKFKGTSQ